MTKPLQGIKVVEVAMWAFVPAAGAILSDMGASVIKVEPPGGDTYRRTMQGLFGEDFIHPSFQFDNRGKRGVCVNLESPEGLELVYRLARDADVFITNLTAPRLARYGLTDKDVHALSPSAVYAVLAGFSVTGPDSHRQAFDQTAFWARSGAMSVFGDRDDGPLISRGGFGDRTTCLNMLAAILAALRMRDKTGKGQYVEVTLQRTGIWALASDVTTALFQRTQPEKTSKKAPANPIWNFYQTRDGRYLALVMPSALPYWPKFCAMVGKPEWASDPRFQTLLGLAEHGPSLVPEISAMFASNDLEYWRGKLDAAGLIWEPVALLNEVIEDPALRAAGAFSTIVHATGGEMEIISAPFHIRDAGIEVRGPAPDAGQHTREVFAEVGVPAATIDELIQKGVLA